MASHSLSQVQRTQRLGQDRDDHIPRQAGQIFHDQDKIIVSIEELYTELYDSERSTTTTLTQKRYQR